MSQLSTGVGLYLFPENGATAAGYSSNLVSGNQLGTVTNGVNLGANYCSGAASCP